MRTDFVSRSEIAQALATAEDRLQQYLGYPVAPRFVEETHPFSFGPIKLRNAKVRRLGNEELTFIGNANVSYVDRDGDGLAETFTVSQATTVTDANDLAVYFVAADGVGRVQPVNVSINSGIATITGAAWLLARPVLYDRPVPEYLDPTNPANYVTTLDVYQRTAGESVVSYTYHPGITTPTDPNYGTWTILDADNGLVYLAPDACQPFAIFGCNDHPTHVTIRYEAGDDPTRWYQAVVRFALAELARPICGCDRENQAIRAWQQDLAQTNSDVTFQVSQDDLSNPFGTRAGAIYAWKAINTPGMIKYSARSL